MSKLRSISRRVNSIRTLEGGGFPVRRPFPIQGQMQFDPFLLLDHFGPVEWEPGEAIGAPNHPHRGFQAVTYLLQGGNLHLDSHGGGGALGPGDVQWMTAGSGLIHSELPSDEILANGGVMEGFQLWVNLPQSHKLIPPEYQELKADKVPVHRFEKGLVKVIAGTAFGLTSPVKTVTPIGYLHLLLTPGGKAQLPVIEGHNAMIYLAHGQARLGEALISEGEMVAFGQKGDWVELINPGLDEPSLLLLSGQPLNEPIYRHGPFVMNSPEEIAQAFEDYRSGKMGRIGS